MSTDAPSPGQEQEQPVDPGVSQIEEVSQVSETVSLTPTNEPSTLSNVDSDRVLSDREKEFSALVNAKPYDPMNEKIYSPWVRLGPETQAMSTPTGVIVRVYHSLVYVPGACIRCPENADNHTENDFHTLGIRGE